MPRIAFSNPANKHNFDWSHILLWSMYQTPCSPLQHSLPATAAPLFNCCEEWCFWRLSTPAKRFCRSPRSVSGCHFMMPRQEELQEILQCSMSQGSFPSSCSQAYVECVAEALQCQCRWQEATVVPFYIRMLFVGCFSLVCVDQRRGKYQLDRTVRIV